MTVGQRTRKVRSDKKREVKPTVSVHLKDAIYIISYVTSTPVKDVAEAICAHGMSRRKVLDYLAQHFRRDIRIGSTLYMGDLSRPSLRRHSVAEKTDRLSLRLKAPEYDKLALLAFALDVTPSRACALLLDASIRNGDFINEYFRDFAKSQLDEQRMKELRKVIRWLNVENPYSDGISWGLLLSYIYANMKDTATNFRESINDFIDRWR